MNSSAKLQPAMKDQLLESLLAVSAECCIVTDGSRHIVAINESFEKASGYRLEEVKGKKESILFPQVWRAAFTSHVFKRIQKGGIWNGEVPFLSKSHDVFRLQVSAYPVFENEKKIAGCIIIGKTTGEMHAAQQQLWTSESILRQLFDAMGDAVVLFDKKGNILMHNEALHKKLGSTERECFASQPSTSWIDPAEMKHLRAALATTEDEGLLSNVLLRARKKDKSRIVFSCTFTKLNDVADNLQGYVATLRDISNVNFSDELSKSKERIGRLVEEIRRKTAMIDVLNQIHLLALKKAPIEKIFKVSVDGIKKIIEHDLAGIYVFIPEKKMFMPNTMSNLTSFSRKLARFPLTLGEGIIGSVANTSTIVLVNNAQNDPRAKYPHGMKPALEHFIAAPLKVRSALYGILVVSRNREPGFLDEEAQLIKSFADAMMLALENAGSHIKQQA